VRIAVKAAQIAPGGGLTHLNKMIEWFGKLAPEIEFVLLARNGQEQLFVPAPRNFKYNYYKFPSLNLPAQLFWERHILPRRLRELGADLLFEPGNRGTLKSSCPKVSLIHNIAPFDDAYLKQETQYQKMRLSLLRQATLESMRASQGIIFISQFCQKLFGNLINMTGVKSTVIYHGRPDDDDIKGDNGALARLSISGPFLLSVSDIWRYKKILEMVKSYLISVANEDSLPPLVIVGANYSPEYFGEIEKLIARTDYGDRIIFTGRIPPGDIRALYQGCQAFLFPSVLEACPNILIEAISSGCAIAASDRGVMPEIAGDAALYFDPDDIGDFSSKIISIFRDKDLNSSLRFRARARARFFSWEKTARETLDFFYEVVGSKHPAGFTHPEHAGEKN
jgi:glycosyltransferase involved in cell wall biosynthesis